MNTNMSPKKSMLVLFCLSLSLFFNFFQSLTTGHWSALILIFSWYYCFLFPEGLYGLLFQFSDFIVSRQNGGISSGCPSTMRAITTHLCLSLLHKLSHKDLSALDTSKQNSPLARDSAPLHPACFMGLGVISADLFLPRRG